MVLVPTQLECPTEQVVPGQGLDCRLRIYNPGEAVNEFTVVGLEEAAPWVSTEPSTLVLMPQTEGEFSLRVCIPADAAIEAGRHTVRLEVRSALDVYEDRTEELIVSVEPRTRWNLETQPQTQRSKTAATYRVQVANQGNHPLRARLAATPSSDTLSLKLSETVVEVPAFQNHTVILRVTPPSPAGKEDVPYRVDVQADVDGGRPESNRVTFVHQPRASRRPFLLLAVAIVGLLALALIFGKSWWDSRLVLERGDTGSKVAEWQTHLNASLGAGLEVDGRFGSQTQQATRVFQQSMGLPLTGAVDRQTWSAMQQRLSDAAPGDQELWKAGRELAPPDEGLPDRRERSPESALTSSPWSAASAASGTLKVDHQIAAKDSPALEPTPNKLN